MGNLFGLDIGSSTIKIVQLAKESGKFTLLSLGRIQSPQPGMAGETESQWAEVAGAVKKLINELKLKSKNVAINLPEHEVISRLIWFPPMRESEVRAALEFEAETFVPHPLDKVQMDYEIVDKDENGRVLVFAIASLKSVVQKYLTVAKLLAVNPVALEPPSVSLSRIFAVDEKPIMILDLGYKYSSLLISKQRNVFLTRTLPIGNEAFLRAISVSLGLELNVADSYRQAYGLKSEELEGKVRKALMPLFEKLIEEIRKAVLAFKEEWQEDIGVITLVGGGSSTPGFTEEMARIIGLEVQIAQPFTGVKIASPLTIDVSKEGAHFATVFGLAARELIN